VSENMCVRGHAPFPVLSHYQQNKVLLTHMWVNITKSPHLYCHFYGL